MWDALDTGVKRIRMLANLHDQNADHHYLFETVAIALLLASPASAQENKSSA